MNKQRERGEHYIQADFFTLAWLNRRAHPQIYAALYSVPNGAYLPRKSDHRTGKMICREMIWLKKEGLRPGVPDVNLDLACGGYNGLRIEFKSAGGSLSQAQKEWRDRLIANGYCWQIFRNAEMAWMFVLEYAAGRIRRETDLFNSCTT